MSNEFLDEYDQHWKLRRVKRFIALGGIAVFIVKNWGYTFLTAQFLWTCFLARRHDLPINAIYMHVDMSAAQAAGSLALMMICGAGVLTICIIVDALFAPVNLTEAELDSRRTAALRRYKLLIREARGLETSEKILAENIQLRFSLTRLHEDLTKLRVEMDTIKVKTSRKAKTQDIDEQDLFMTRPKREAHSKKRHKAAPPKF